MDGGAARGRTVRSDQRRARVVAAHVRNICAHHGRLWNRALMKSPQLPSFHTSQAWYQPSIDTKKIYAALTVCNFLVNTITRGAST